MKINSEIRRERYYNGWIFGLFEKTAGAHIRTNK